ncbi:DUF881 domain-containing protein [Metallumcola ferriviriculae]|uniref:DUF881 domain-containing protein n=1 Tax=Metallumcola ferriviriculae TaxID=3039180 RepID=A0AAU0UQ24_9FIRM|nr:DUF881 domain-containing protein [Desulfitibacteraceae bacterium MK1]
MRRDAVSNKALWVALVLMLVVMVFNSAMLARTAGYIQFPGELTRLDMARHGAEMLVQYNEQQAAEAGVITNSAVRDVLAQFKFEVDRATTPDEIVKLETKYSREIQDVVQREQDNKRRETVLSLLNQDTGLSSYDGQATITVYTGDNNEVIVDDPTSRLKQGTIDQIKSHPLLQGTWPMMEFEITSGKTALVTARSLLDRLKMRADEVNSLRNKLQELNVKTGFAEMSGTGIIIELYDSQEGISSVDIVHDRDVRDVVNELFTAGASGVSVGNQRLTTTSSIRCAGPIILVNQQPIAVNPIVIKAVGDPKILASSLDLIRRELEEFGIQFIITPSNEVLLPSYKAK